MDSDAPADPDALRKYMYCGAPAVGQSMLQHVAQTVDAEHGAFQTIPNDFRLDDCPHVNE